MSDATGQQPHPIASISELDSASDSEGSTKMSIARSHGATFRYRRLEMAIRIAARLQLRQHRPAPHNHEFHPAPRRLHLAKCLHQDAEPFLRTQRAHDADHHRRLVAPRQYRTFAVAAEHAVVSSPL